jgi:hypothetical protein
MLLHAPGTRFELTLSGYQFPDLVDEKHDANWLIVTMQVEVPEGTYTASSPCLLTWEVAWLAMWLDTVAETLPHAPEWEGLEPKLRFQHLSSHGESVTLRIRARGRLAPLWTPRRAGLVVDLTIPRVQVKAAAASLRAQLQLFPPRAGAETRRPFVPPQLATSFFIDWMLLVPGTEEEEVRFTAIEYLEWLHLQPTALGARLLAQNLWAVRLVTDLHVPATEPFQALFQMLSYLPMPYGAPRIGGPFLAPDGVFTCRGELVPRAVKAEDAFSRIRGQFELANCEDEQRFRWWQGSSWRDALEGPGSA